MSFVRIGTVTVATVDVGTGLPVGSSCSSAGVRIAVTFTSDFGTLPLMTGSSTVNDSVDSASFSDARL